MNYYYIQILFFYFPEYLTELETSRVEIFEFSQFEGVVIISVKISENIIARKERFRNFSKVFGVIDSRISR